MHCTAYGTPPTTELTVDPARPFLHPLSISSPLDVRRNAEIPISAGLSTPISPCRLLIPRLPLSSPLAKGPGPTRPGCRRLAVTLRTDSTLAVGHCTALLCRISGRRDYPRAAKARQGPSCSRDGGEGDRLFGGARHPVCPGPEPTPTVSCSLFSSFVGRRFWQRVAHIVSDSIWTSKRLMQCRIKVPVLVTLACF